MNRVRNINWTAFTRMATLLEYRIHMRENELKWKKNSCSMKKEKHAFASCFITSTALCTDLGPSGPLSARPGPSMPHRDPMPIVSYPKPIAMVVTPK